MLAEQGRIGATLVQKPQTDSAQFLDRGGRPFEPLHRRPLPRGRVQRFRKRPVCRCPHLGHPLQKTGGNVLSACISLGGLVIGGEAAIRLGPARRLELCTHRQGQKSRVPFPSDGKGGTGHLAAGDVHGELLLRLAVKRVMVRQLHDSQSEDDQTQGPDEGQKGGSDGGEGHEPSRLWRGQPGRSRTAIYFESARVCPHSFACGQVHLRYT
jgi:hypothetical protein